MSSVPNSYIDDLRSIILATLNRIEQLRMRVLFGVQFVKGAYGQELEFRSNGYSYIDGVLITGGGTGDFMADGSVPMTGDLDMNDNNLANCNVVNGRIDSILQITSNYQILRLNAETGYDIVMGDPIAMGTNKITGLGTPTSEYDAATKKYVDDYGSGDFMADGSVPMTGNFAFNKIDPSIIFETGNYIYLDSSDDIINFVAGGSSPSIVAYIAPDRLTMNTGYLHMGSNHINHIKYADAESNVLAGLFTQHDRDANGWDYYSAFHSYMPSAVAALQSTHRMFGISSEIHTEGLYAGNYTRLTTAINSTVTTIPVVSTSGFPSTGSIRINGEHISYTGITATTFTGCTRAYLGDAAAHSTNTSVIENTSYFTHTVGLFGAVVSGDEPDSCQIWGLNTLIESQYNSSTGLGYEESMQGYECDVNRALPHVMKEDGGKFYTNYYSSGNKGSELLDAVDMLVALNTCIGVNVTGINDANPGIAFNVAGGGSAYWNVGLMMDYPFEFAAIVMGDGQKVMWKNNYTGNYEKRFENIEGEFNIFSGANTVGTGNLKLWSNFDIDLNCGTGGQVNLNGDINLADFDIISVDNFYMDGILDISDSTGAYYSTQQQVGVNSILDINAAGQFIFKKSLNVWNKNITNVANPGADDHADNQGMRDTAIAVHRDAYGHLSIANETDLTDGGSTSLHKHFPFTEDISWNKSYPGMVFDTDDAMYYDKANNQLRINIGGTIRAYCDTSGWHVGAP
jgi:hypothetical protein